MQARSALNDRFYPVWIYNKSYKSSVFVLDPDQVFSEETNLSLIPGDFGTFLDHETNTSLKDIFS